MTDMFIPLLVALAFGICIGLGFARKGPYIKGGYQPKETGLKGTPPSRE